jgi:hypothetical protein
MYDDIYSLDYTTIIVRVGNKERTDFSRYFGASFEEVEQYLLDKEIDCYFQKIGDNTHRIVVGIYVLFVREHNLTGTYIVEPFTQYLSKKTSPPVLPVNDYIKTTCIIKLIDENAGGKENRLTEEQEQVLKKVDKLPISKEFSPSKTTVKTSENTQKPKIEVKTGETYDPMRERLLQMMKEEEDKRKQKQATIQQAQKSEVDYHKKNDYVAENTDLLNGLSFSFENIEIKEKTLVKIRLDLKISLHNKQNQNLKINSLKGTLYLSGSKAASFQKQTNILLQPLQSQKTIISVEISVLNSVMGLLGDWNVKVEMYASVNNKLVKIIESNI